MSGLILEGFIDVPESALETVIAELPNHIHLTQQEKGCIAFRVEQDSENAFRFHVFEAFTDRSAFEAHQQRVKHSEWGRITANVQRTYRITGG